MNYQSGNLLEVESDYYGKSLILISAERPLDAEIGWSDFTWIGIILICEKCTLLPYKISEILSFYNIEKIKPSIKNDLIRELSIKCLDYNCWTLDNKNHRYNWKSQRLLDLLKMQSKFAKLKIKQICFNSVTQNQSLRLHYGNYN